MDMVQLLASPVNIMWLGSIQQDPDMQSAIVQALYGTITINKTFLSVHDGSYENKGCDYP
jgi:hypothetical protein